LKWLTFIGCFAYILSLATLLHGQAVPTASRGGSIQVGLGGMITNPDYAQRYIKGLTFYGDFDFRNNIGIEGEMNFAVSTPSDISEDSYLFGPRYTIHRKKFGGYAKVLLGVGRFGTQEGSYVNIATTSYFEYAVGGGLEYLATRKINVRIINVEMQKWPNFAPHGLTPIAYTFGVAYVFH
jgi:hypothetical protein